MEVTSVKREKLYNLILSDLNHGNYTAREISVHLYNKGLLPYPTRQDTAPRLTELCRLGKVEVIDSVIDEVTKKRVSVYRKVVE